MIRAVGCFPMERCFNGETETYLMDFKSGKTLLVAIAILVFIMIYAIGVFAEVFLPPAELWNAIFGDTVM